MNWRVGAGRRCGVSLLLVLVLSLAQLGCNHADSSASATPAGPIVGMSAEDPTLDPYLRQLFAGPDESALVNGVFSRVSEYADDSAGSAGLSTLTPEQRVVYDVWYAKGLIDNGGFSYLFSSSAEVSQTLAGSYDAIGATEAAKAAREALAVLPGGGALPLGDDGLALGAREQLLEGLSEEDAERLDEISEVIWSSDRAVVRLTAEYVRRNVDQFKGLPPSVYEDAEVFAGKNLPAPAADADELKVSEWLDSIDSYKSRRGHFLAYRTIPVTVPRAGNVIMQVAFGEHRRSTDAELEHVASLKALGEIRSLGFANSRLTRAGLVHLQKFPHLQVLNLSDTDLQDDWIAEIVQLKGLRELSLADTAITDAGVRQLAALQELRGLELRGTQVIDDGISELAALKRLEELDLSYTPITGAGLAGLSSLPIRELELSNSHVSDEGMVGLTQFRQLKSLHLRSAKLTSKGLASLSPCVSIEMLDLGSTIVDDEGLSHLVGLENLTDLQLEYTKVTGSGFGGLTGLKKLTSLRLSGSPVNDEGIAAISKLPAVESLMLYDTQITGRSLSHFATMKKLKTLSLINTQTPGSAELRQLEKLQSLESLSLPESLKDNPHAKYLQQKLPACDVSFY